MNTQMNYIFHEKIKHQRWIEMGVLIRQLQHKLSKLLTVDCRRLRGQLRLGTSSPQQFRDQIKTRRAKSDEPFNVNAFSFDVERVPRGYVYQIARQIACRENESNILPPYPIMQSRLFAFFNLNIFEIRIPNRTVRAF